MPDLKWQNVVAIKLIILALLLIIGVLYFRARDQDFKHGTKFRLFTDEEKRLVVTPVSAVAQQIKENSNDEHFAGGDSYIPHITNPNAHYITEACMQCLCETVTECKAYTCGANQPCGLFRINQSYWYDAGEPLLEGDLNVIDHGNSLIEYTNCVNNPYCAARTVVQYMKRYGRDCNEDGKVTCYDYVAIHILGPNGCKKQSLPAIFAERMNKCFNKLALDRL